MEDRLGELERRWRQTGADADGLAWLREHVRLGNLPDDPCWRLITLGLEDAQLARLEVEQNPGALQLYTIGGETALHYLAIENRAATVRMLLSMGADPDPTDGLGSTPLIDCATLGHVELVAILLEAGADPNHQNRLEESALDYARKNEHEEIVRILEAAGGRRGSAFAFDPDSIVPQAKRRGDDQLASRA